METSSIVLLLVSSVVSFGLGRVFMHARKKKRAEQLRQAQERAAQALREQPPEAESKNKSKRKRQQLDKKRANPLR